MIYRVNLASHWRAWFDALNQITTYTYDGEGRVLSLTDGKGATRQWVYDILGRVKRKVHPDNTFEETTYRLDSSVASVRTPAGAICTYSYSSQGLVLNKAWNDGTANVAYSYDAIARQTASANGTSTVGYTYDALSRKASETQNVSLTPSPVSLVSYSYSNDGHLAALTYPDGHVVEYAYSARHQLAAVTAGGPPPVATYSYDAAGELTTRTLENGVSTGYAYDVAGQLTGMAQTLNNVAFDTLGYTLDNRGRRTGITRANGKNDGYSYDAIGEVVGGAYTATATGNQTEAFAYDAAGNRLTSARNGANTAYTANANDQYTTVGGAAQNYDANGNNTLASIPGAASSIAMQWDSENRLLSTQSTTAKSDHGYDALHRRVWKKVYATDGNGGWTLAKTVVFTYDGWNVIAEKEYQSLNLNPSTLTLSYRYTWGADVSGSLQGAGGVGGLLMTEEINGATATPHYYCYDGNGNMTHIVDAAGNLEASHRYTAFGGNLESVTTTAFAQRNPWRFSTKYLDREVEITEGIYYYGYRFYLTALGRWPSRDPIAEKGGRNLYGMVGNNAVGGVDWLGLATTMHTTGEGDWKINFDNDVSFTENPLVDAWYEPGPEEKKCCKGIRIHREAKKYDQKWYPDGDQDTIIVNVPGIVQEAHAEPDQPGFTFFGTIASPVRYIFGQEIAFYWEAICIAGPSKGKTLSTLGQVITIGGGSTGINEYGSGFYKRRPPDPTQIW